MTVLAGSLKNQAFLLNAESIKIGRGPGVDFELNENSISKVHAQVDILGDQIRIQDLGSRNGVLVYGRREPRALLRHGAVIAIGGAKIEFLLHDVGGPSVVVVGKKEEGVASAGKEVLNIFSDLQKSFDTDQDTREVSSSAVS